MLSRRKNLFSSSQRLTYKTSKFLQSLAKQLQQKTASNRQKATASDGQRNSKSKWHKRLQNCLDHFQAQPQQREISLSFGELTHFATSIKVSATLKALQHLQHFVGSATFATLP